MQSEQRAVTVGPAPLTVDDIAAVADGARVELDRSALSATAAAAQRLSDLVESGALVYGLTTGVGDRFTDRLDDAGIAASQLMMLRSHACGLGTAHPTRVVRAIMACLAQSLAQGHSGVRPQLLTHLAEMLNRGVAPWAPSQGSVGYLIATAHIGLVLFGHGKAWYRGELLDGADAMRRAGIAVDQPGLREGHALISGTHEITAIGALAIAAAESVVRSADIAAAMSVEALRGNTRGYDPRVQALRPHPGQRVTAERLMRILDGSEILAASRDVRLQDPLSLRCVPQVHGAVRDMLARARQTLEIEINSVTDNPAFVFEGHELVALVNGNGHGAPTATVLDAVAVAISELTSMSQVRSDRLTNAHLSGLPAFLVQAGGEDPGLMIPPYVAAELAAENRQLAQPASAHTMSMSAGQEDHVSQGVLAAQEALRAVRNAAGAIAVELLCAAQGLEFHYPARPGIGTRAAHRRLRASVPAYSAHRELHEDLGKTAELVLGGQIDRAVADALASYEQKASAQ